MSTLPGKTVLITGANAGIGKDVARQLASRPEFARIYLACRNEDRAIRARSELESVTGRSIFDIILMDVADLGSVRAGHGFEFGLSLCRPILVSARQVDPRELRT